MEYVRWVKLSLPIWRPAVFRLARNSGSRDTMKEVRRWLLVRIATASLLVLSGAPGIGSLAAQPSTPIVYVISIEGMIDLGLAPFLSRTLREAREEGAAAVLLDINTFGGRVD